MINSTHFFNSKKQQIYFIGNKPLHRILYSRNAFKYMLLRFTNPYLLLKILLLLIGITELIR